MQKNPRYKKTRNKNRNHQMSYDSPEGEGEFLNESNDSMLTVSDSLGNMDPYDSSLTSEIDRTLLDEFAGDSELAAENDFVSGDESAPKRRGASVKKPEARKHSASRPQREPKVAARVSMKAPKDDQGQNLKGQLSLITAKVQKAVLPYTEDLQGKAKDLYRVARERSRGLDKTIRTQPYFLALGAVVVGFAIARMTQNGSMKR
ncbi:MAG: hypothetical protein EOP07_04005 [Proteobacteria bacterium]|nr:MAG: hypothetical protein EOP07_04005 [Pseudomonadota bacterium]